MTVGINENSGSLPRNRIGTFRLIWQAMGALSPAADVAYLLTGVALFALGATPLSIILGIVAYLLIMNTSYQFSKHISSAGSYYTFVGKSLGGTFATYQGWNMVFYVTLGYSGFGFLGLASFLTLINPAYSGPLYWIPIVLIATTIAFLFTYFGIKISTTYQYMGGILEIGLLIVGAIVLIIAAGHSNTLAVFTTKYVPGGIKQVIFSMIYSVVLYFGTSLSITSLAEETKLPKKSVPKALLATVIISGITMVLISYAMTVKWGPSLMSSFASSPDPGLILFKSVSYILFLLLVIFTVNSFMGYNVAVSNANSRNFYAFARDGVVMPRSLNAIHPKYGSPHKTALLIYVISIVISLTFGLLFGPLAGGLIMLFANAYAAYFEHILASIGLPFFARKNNFFNLLYHLIIPIIGIAILLAVIVSTVYPALPSYPYNIAVIIGIAWLGVSALLTYVEIKLHPSRVKNAGKYSLTGEDYEAK